MKTKTIQPANAGKLSAVEQKHLSTLRALGARRHRLALEITRRFLSLDMAAGTARIEAPKVAAEARKAGKHLRLVVDNTVTP